MGILFIQNFGFIVDSIDYTTHSAFRIPYFRFLARNFDIKEWSNFNAGTVNQNCMVMHIHDNILHTFGS